MLFYQTYLKEILKAERTLFRKELIKNATIKQRFPRLHIVDSEKYVWLSIGTLKAVSWLLFRDKHE